MLLSLSCKTFNKLKVNKVLATGFGGPRFSTLNPGSRIMSEPGKLPLSLMTFNVRYDTPNDGVDNWKERKNDVLDFLRNRNPTFLCLQETLMHQVTEIAEGLVDYKWFGAGRQASNTKEENECNPIFYNIEAVELLDSGTFWLSETPLVPGSRYQDTRLPRICTWGEFKLKHNGRIRIYNTHLDHKTASARVFGLELISNKMANHSDWPMILCGDFNASSDEEPLQYLNQLSWLRDSKSLFDDVEDLPTFTGFTGESEKMLKIIDYIYVNMKCSVVRQEVIVDIRPNGRYLSDHRPVMIFFNV